MGTPPRWLFWHRRDLRLADNLGLAAAAARTPAVTGVFVLDPAILAGAAGPVAPARLWFLAESLKELMAAWRDAGSRLVLLQGDPLEQLPRLAAAIGAEVVAWNRDVEPYARHRDKAVATALQAAGRKVLVEWDQLLLPPDAVRTGGGEPYRVYGPYWRNWRSQVERRAALGAAAAGGLEPAAAPAGLLDLEAALRAKDSWRQLPRLEAVPATLGADFGGAALCPCRPGEAAAREQLQAFCDGGTA
ncbi:MAG: deoxyribodipyrimidine photo-lyase, partial [Cyanobacteriota bacterium]|nr:deoxyribodipyrimidine photo-lyase [Cyanobacteriota bacterium]